MEDEKLKQREAKKAAQLAAKEEKKKKAEAKKAQQEKWKQQQLSTQSTKDVRLRDKNFKSETPEGEKKDTSKPMADAYDPASVEDAWYAWWVKQGYFSAEYKRPGMTQEEHDKLPPFVMVIPPPNVTGALHIGHALTNSIEDAICRWQRMNGKRVLWVPGTDHAGIATQSVVERRLWDEEKKTRHDLGREEFIKKVWEWKESYGGRICDQLKRLGSSLDWSYERFTMDEAVKEAFIQFHAAGLIYRANRLVNWSCSLQTAISDIECDDWELKEPDTIKVPGHPDNKKYEFGWIWSFAYKVVGSDEEIVVATTRPETMLGDTAVAVHPEDEQYKHLHGKLLAHPFVDREIPIICDDKLVKMGFGTGAVKVTPSHDLNDYECGKRNTLRFINVLNPDGSLNEEAGEFKGMMRFEARVAVLKRLEELGLFRGKAKNEMTLKICSRSGDIIEPFMSPQWYVDMNDLAKRSMDAVEKGELEIFPPAKVASWNEFLGNIRPWCISRQLWWGHRIPAYIAWKKGDAKPDTSLTESWIVAESAADARKIAETKLGTSDVELEQDDDVLDTWFSSGLFPFSVFGWPDKTADLEKYYPTQFLETGHDILFFWVARMVMMGLQLTGKLPFNQVLLHSLVRDKNGKKMSKTSGNVIDPIDVIEGITLEGLHDTIRSGNLRKDKLEEAIKVQKKDFPKGISECGTDALRFTLCAYTSQGRDINLDVLRVEGYRTFCNKIWQATKLAFIFLGDKFTPAEEALTPKGNLFDKWILSKLCNTIDEVNKGITEYDFAKATSAIYSFFLYNFCDVYMEACKTDIYAPAGQKEEAKEAHRQTIYTILDESYRLLHPFMPYITEELWQRLPRRAPQKEFQTICLAPYPLLTENNKALWNDSKAEEQIAYFMDLVKTLRSSCATYGLIKRKTVTATATITNGAAFELLSGHSQDVIALAYLKELIVTQDETAPTGAATEVVNSYTTLYIKLEGVDIMKELDKLNKQRDNIQKQITNLQKLQEEPNYKEKAKDSIKEQDSAKLAQLRTDLKGVEKAIETLSKM